MLFPTTITAKWQMTIPRSARKLLGITRSGKVLVEVKKQAKTMTIKHMPSIFELAGTFVPKGKLRHVSVLKTREYMEKHYERV